MSPVPPHRRSTVPAPTLGEGGFRVGPWWVEPATGKLQHRDGNEEHLRPQEMNLLCCLASADGRVVAREEILAEVWDDAAVEEGAITRCVSEIRKALGDEAKAPRFIETIPKRGYRLIVAVEPMAAMAAEDAPGQKPSPRLSRSLIAGAVAVVVAVVVAAAAAFGPDPGPTSSAATVSTAGDRPVIAVLGFNDLSGDGEADWLSSALPEMLATELASAESLRVVAGETVSRMERELSLDTSGSLAAETLDRIRTSLGADLVVVGAYLLQGDSDDQELRLDLKLQDTTSGETVSALAQRGSLDRLGDLVSTTGVGLRDSLGAAPPTRSWTGPSSHLPEDPEAVRLYAEGLGKLRRLETVAARDLLLETIAREPQQPLAHLALAEASKALGHDARAAVAARRANEQRAALSRELQLWIEASYLTTLGRMDEAIDLFGALWVFSPENLEYGLRLAETQNAAGRPAEAVETVERIRQRAGETYRDPRLELVVAGAARQLGELDRSLVAATEAIELGRALVAPLVVARGRRHRASALHAMGRLPEAITALEDARAAFAAAGDLRNVAAAQRDLAGWLTIRGAFDRAEELASEALATSRTIGNRAGEAAALRALAEVKWRIEDPEAAEAALRQSMAIYRETNDRRGEATVNQTLGILAGSQQRLTEAAERFGAALAIYRELGAKVSLAATLSNLGKVQLLAAAPAEAETYLRESEELARELGMVNRLAVVRFNRGYSALSRGDTKLGLAAFSEAIDIFRRLDNPLMIAASHQGLGEIHFLRGELDAARTQMEEALAGRIEIEAEGGSEQSVMESRAALASVLSEQGQREAAEEMARMAVEMGRTPQTLGTLAQVLLEQGRLAEAEELAVEAGSLFQDRGQKSHRVLNHTLLTARLQAASGDPDGARSALAAVITEARERGAWTLSARAQLHLGEIEIDSGHLEAGGARLIALEAEASAREAYLLAAKARQARRSKRPETLWSLGSSPGSSTRAYGLAQ